MSIISLSIVNYLFASSSNSGTEDHSKGFGSLLFKLSVLFFLRALIHIIATNNNGTKSITEIPKKNRLEVKASSVGIGPSSFLEELANKGGKVTEGINLGLKDARPSSIPIRVLIIDNVCICASTGAYC